MLLEKLFGPDVVGYDAPLDLAKRWRLSGDSANLNKAAGLLAELAGVFPLAVPIIEELLLVQMTVSPAEAAATLQDAEHAFTEPSEELLCRFGRMYKDHGDTARTAKDYSSAEISYRKSADRYEKAYKIRDGHYPGINLATLSLIRAGLARLTGRRADEKQLRADATSLARELLAARKSWPDDQPEDRDIWHPATEAEALLVLRNWPKAAKLYASISGPRWAFQTMKKQVDRILDAWRALGQTEFGPFNNLADVFHQQ